MRRSYEPPVRVIDGDPLSDVLDDVAEQVVSGEDTGGGRGANVEGICLHNHVQKQEYPVSNPGTPVMNDTVLL